MYLILLIILYLIAIAWHSRICEITKNTYTLPEHVANDITNNTNYSINYTPDISTNVGTFDSST